MKELLLKKKIIILGIAVIGIAISVYFYQQKSNEEGDTNFSFSPIDEVKKDEINQQEKAANGKMFIDVKGAVLHPGVYDAEEDDRVLDIIQKAGGFLKKADQRKVNLAEKVHDEMVIYVPKKGESPDPDINITTMSPNQDNGKVNLNTASLEQLQTLTGIGPSKAAAIVEYREKNGGFKKVEELTNVTGIGDKTFEKLKDSITVQ